MGIFREDKDRILVDSFAVEVYLPAKYADSQYRGTAFYSVIGTQVRYFAVGNFRAFKSEKEMDDPVSIPTYVLGIPMTILSKPTEIDVRNVKFTKSGPERKCIVLTFYKDDEFMCNKNGLKSANHVIMLLQMIEAGKLTFVPPDMVPQLLQDAQSMNGVDLRVPAEELEMFIAERYRNPNRPSEKLRFSESMDPDSDRIVSFRLRDEAMQSTTYQAITGEDLNNALITSINRTKRGEYNEPTIPERITRGLDISDLNKEENIPPQINPEE